MKLRKAITRRRVLIGMASILIVLMLVAAACGEAATPEPTEEVMEATPEPTEEVMEDDAMDDDAMDDAAMEDDAMDDDAMDDAAMEDDAMDDAMDDTAMEDDAMDDTAMEDDAMVGMRGPDQWTAEEPATRAEIEAELEKFRGDSFVFVSWGGAYQAAQRQAYIVPFEAQFGIDVIEESVPTAAKTRAMVETENIEWHVIDNGTAGAFQLALSGDLEELDFSIIDTRDFLSVVQAPWFGGGGITWSTVLAYNTDTYPNGLPDMSAYYDTERYPGRRGWAYYSDHEEVFVLLGDDPSILDTAEGRASLATLTDDQMDRAYELFEQHKDQISLFWQTGSDCPQLLISGELDMCTAWNGRIYDAQKEGAPLAICWHCGHQLNTDVWYIPRGLSTQDPDKFYLAQLFMAWTSFPEINADVSQFITYGPVNIKSLSYLDAPEFDAVRDELPSSPANIQYAILYDEKWGGEVADARYERYLEWQQGL